VSMPWGSTEEPETERVELGTVPVHVVSSGIKTEKSVGTEFGRWRTLLVANVVNQDCVTPGGQRLLNRSLRRHRALIGVFATIAAQPVLDGVIVGSPGEIASGNPAVPGRLGGYLPIGSNFRYESQAELWVCYPSTNVNPVYVTICDEVYASGESRKERE